METQTRGRGHEYNLAWRKAEEAALRRYQATHWLECFVGPLGISSQPSEREFVSCLRSGLVLCNLINKVQTGSVPKVVENHTPSQSIMWDSQPLPAYQYFENIRNFLVAVDDLKLPAFEASVFERDNIEAGSSTKVVDCILELKAYHEWKQMTGGVGFYKPLRSPLLTPSRGRIQAQTHVTINSDSRRRLEMSASFPKQSPSEDEIQKLEGIIVNALAERMVDMKENIGNNFFASFQNGNTNQVEMFSRIFSSCFKEQLQNKSLKLNSDPLKEKSCSEDNSTCIPLQDLSNLRSRKCCRACIKKGNCNHWTVVTIQEKELSNLKALLSSTKKEFENLQSQLQSDLKQLGDQVLDMSNAALGYHKVMKENRSLHNMVQDLKGNIRVYCRIRPTFNAEAKTAIDFIGEDGSLVVIDPLKSWKEGRKIFQFNRVFGTSATQEDVFRDTKPLVRSVMDGYNVCIFAYGQTGSGKTYTMSGPGGGSTKEFGINQLALNDLFVLSDERKDIMSYKIHVQMVEIYNEQIHDLLADDSLLTKLEIRSCMSGNGLPLPDASMHLVNCATDVIALMKLGDLNRAVGCTAMNNRSSRSHSVLTVHVHGEDTSGNIIRSCLHLVDLAGSERVDKSEVTGDSLKEAQHINKSLSCLGDVITALAQKNSHIPYRNSKLTLLLQNSLGGHAKTLMFAHVSPEGDSFGETISTLKFAQRVSSVELGAARLNKESIEVLELKAEIETLKRALANKEALTPQINKTKEAARTPFQKPKAIGERSTPRARRLSIENCTTTVRTEKANLDDEKGSKTPAVKTRSRRLSLEGPRLASKNFEHIKLLEPTSKRNQQEVVCLQQCTEFQEGDDVTKLYDQAGKDSFLNAPLSPPFAFRSQKAPQSPASGLQAPRSPTFGFEIQQAPRGLTSGFKSQQPPRSPTSTYKSHQAPRSPTSGFKSLQAPRSPTPTCKSQQPPRSPTSGFKSQQAPPNPTSGSKSQQAPRSPTPTYKSQQHPRSPTSGFKSQQTPLSPTSGFKSQQAPRSPTPTYKSQQPPRSPTSGFKSQQASLSPTSAFKSCNAPKGPTSAATKSQGVKTTDNRTRILSLQLPKTPEPLMTSIKENEAGMQSERTISSEVETPTLISRTHGKGSQIRRSLRTIGKLINGSERKNQQKKTEAAPLSPLNCLNEETSSMTSNSRTLRRQSLTGIPPPIMSRRSSLGGGSLPDYCANESKNLKTPGASAKLTKRWL
ncbi:kinesin-like protein KIN-14L [Solanum lycopersicum]|uniref:kinesin-like protein KIN-14L n=1 Tax=Solanum lycopersicum TaxID=4081 RepID=UPI000532D573|nr:kinesin-like protein KIN-14L [Solanum lycopersicum]XP_010319180.1 kinesin-like protein KIN-14L [Solanum lycopersicum]